MNITYRMDHVSSLSEVLYVGLCRKIGTPTEEAIRRDVLDMEEMIVKTVHNQAGLVMMKMGSGSHREGVRLVASDRDIMFWNCNFKLITDICQFRLFDPTKHIILLMEDSDTPPGFVRLRLLTPTQNKITTSCLVPCNGCAYISSCLWREVHLQLLTGVYTEPLRINGPCSSGFHGSIEFDAAMCLVSFPWPKLLGSWVDRCQRHTWPPVRVLQKILKNECHCVPIGSKVDVNSNKLEWRLSFSQAEQQVVCTMNHTQFLCYGLLKIYLKEVINYRKLSLLCSYFMKTTMFWMMQLGQVKWCPNKLLGCFWRCFRYLIHCVYRGVFPSFFIPKNNMFFNKIVDDARESLLQQLYQNYEMGVSCLLRSPTLRSILEPALCSPTFVLSPAAGELMSVADLDICGMYEVSKLSFFIQHIWESYLYLKSMNKLSQLSISPYQIITLQYCTAQTLFRLAFIMANSTSCYTNKSIYYVNTTICGMLKMAARLGPVSFLLCLALFYYRTRRYDKTLHLICITKQRLLQDFIIYKNVNRQRYNEAVSNLSLCRRMQIAWVDNVLLFQDVPCIEELYLEQNVSKKHGQTVLHLSPFLLVEMLSVLSQYRLDNRSQCLQSLTDLQTLLLYDDGKFVPLHLRDLSWQVLGICQHVVGDLNGALRSFEESLKQDPFHRIQEATDFRIELLNNNYREMYSCEI